MAGNNNPVFFVRIFRKVVIGMLATALVGFFIYAVEVWVFG